MTPIRQPLDDQSGPPQDYFAARLASVPVVAILRGLEPDPTVQLATACWRSGIELVEVPAQGAAGLRSLEAAAEAARELGATVGAGTVYTADHAAQVRDAGAGFLVSPGLDEGTARFAADNELPYLPGVSTPTEVQAALALGLHTVKLFPAGAMGTLWLSALKGPFPTVRFVAVGGVSPENAQTYLDHGACGVGIGGALSDPRAIEKAARLAPPSRP
jgi:2-dehydro-3-deoxyphosphogluconate aldolase/(4S)-4-hydroxy-2-oxoglutarate aldolase